MAVHWVLSLGECVGWASVGYLMPRDAEGMPQG